MKLYFLNLFLIYLVLRDLLSLWIWRHGIYFIIHQFCSRVFYFKSSHCVYLVITCHVYLQVQVVFNFFNCWQGRQLIVINGDVYFIWNLLLILCKYCSYIYSWIFIAAELLAIYFDIRMNYFFNLFKLYQLIYCNVYTFYKNIVLNIYF